ncbi:MAG: ABC transporter substrate-binding protein [Hyphomicrobiaceae bacterium]|nr:ABC transporter substrate-binding protein [Hyphomicrobiaceae bacterium]
MASKLMKPIRAALLGGAFWAAASVAAYAQEALKIGGMGPLSGGGTSWGLAAQRGMDLAVNDINAAGGIKAEGKTYKLELVFYDDLYTAQGGKAATERLVNQDKVKFIVGPVGSPPALAAISVTNPAKVIALTNGYAPGVLKNDTKDPYNFRLYNTNLEFGPPIIKWIKENLKEVKKIGLLAPNDAVGQAVAKPLAADYEKEGFQVVLDFFERGTKEFTPLILRMMAQKVDAFEFDGNSPGDAGLMLKQIRQAGFKGKVFQVGGPAVDEIIEIAGPAAEGFMTYDFIDWDMPKAKVLREAYIAKYGKGIISPFMPAFYHGVYMVAEAIKRADSVDTAKVRTAMEGLSGFDIGIYGPVKWIGKETYGVNRQLMMQYFFSEVKGGKIVKIKKFTP